MTAHYVNHLCNFGLPLRLASKIAMESKPAGTIVFAADKDTNTAELMLYEFIGYDWWTEEGMTAKRFAEELQQLGDIDSLTVRINSPGGDVFDGFAMHNQLVGVEYDVKVVIEGIAASAASVVAMAGDTVSMYETSTLMIHDAWMHIMGNEQDLRDAADVLGKLDSQIAETYAARSSQTVTELRELMNKDTYITASEAVEMGLADDIVTTPKKAAENATRAAKHRKIKHTLTNSANRLYL